MKGSEYAEKLLQLVEEGVSPFHVTAAVEERLKEAGFEELFLRNDWGLDYGGKYYVKHHDSSLFAFTIGTETDYFPSLRIAAAHTDFPSLRIKPNPEVVTEGYMQLNVEVYGGAILNTWLDRPLSVAGRVALKSEDPFHPKLRLVNIRRPILTIPNLAIHMNREVNKGVELNRQTDMEPIMGMVTEELNRDGFFMEFLAGELHVASEDILDFELNLYNTDTGDYVGMNQDFISAPRLDNLTGVQAVLTGILEEDNRRNIHMAAFFDHEEIGSRTKQGAGSNILGILSERIFLGLGHGRERYLGRLEEGLLLSVDVGHALHPNYVNKNDPTNRGLLNRGLLIKEAAAQSYATDCEAVGIVMQFCQKEHIAYQKFANRSDGTSGGTLGSIASAMLPVRTVDIGVPLLAMHSARELMGTQDQEALTRLIRAFFSL